MKRLVAGAAIPPLVVGLAACTRSEEAEGPPAIGEVSVVTDVRQFTYPLSSYEGSAQQMLTVQRAEDLLARRCMLRFGFDWAVPRRSATDFSPSTRRYGVTDLASVKRWGYHLPPEVIGSPGSAAQFGELSGEALAVFLGRGASRYGGVHVPKGGCLGEARRRIGTDEARSTLLLLDLRGEAARRSMADRRVRSAFDSWSTCMRGRGYDYRDPWAAKDDPAWVTPAPTPPEIATAIADVTCKRQVNLIGLWFAVEVAYQKRLIEQHSGELAVQKRRREEQVRLASTVLDEG